ncbi:MAG: dimethylarginine dimethylaminohydrolase family protein [Candidatus Thorarchaeota archaeon]
MSLAREQHNLYCFTLIDLGFELIKLPMLESHPDSCFVEDTAVIHGKRALITRMKPESRRGEETAVELILSEHLDIRSAIEPATVEGGDVLHLNGRLISGISQRTNPEGIAQMENWFNIQVDTIKDVGIVHLKSYLTYLGKGVILGTERYQHHEAIADLEFLVLPKTEAYAANTLALGDVVLMPANYPKSHEIVREAGFDVIPIDVSEFEKCEGALTCLSLLF